MHASKKQKKEFSKALLIQESALIWILSIGFLLLAFYCIHEGYTGSLPWLAAMVSFPWAAYGVSQMFYYKKSLAENVKDGIKYESVLKELDHELTKKQEEMFNTKYSYEDFSGLDVDTPSTYTSTAVDDYRI